MKVTEKLFESSTASVSVTEEISATVSIEITLNDRNSENHSQIDNFTFCQLRRKSSNEGKSLKAFQKLL